jgi:hypothetical protein
MSNPFQVLKVEGEGAGTPSASAYEEKVADEEQVDVGRRFSSVLYRFRCRYTFS